MKHIGVIGSGTVGVVLANGFKKHGYEVMIGTNHAAKAVELASRLSPGITVGSFVETAAFGDLVVLAVKGTAAEEVIKTIAVSIAGKTVIDTTNPIAELPPVNGVLQYFTNINSESLMERIQRLVPEAHVVKAFNSVGNAFMVNPEFSGGKPTMFICGDEAGAKTQVRQILDAFGFETEDLGAATSARAIEPLCILWCIPGFIGNGWNHAFKLLKQ